MSKIKGLIFDLDGVLVSTEHNHFVAWKRTADALGIPFSEEDNEQLKGVSRVDSLKKILALGNRSISAEEFELLLQQKNDFYLDSIAGITEEDALAGVLELLMTAKGKGLLLAVGSSSKNAPVLLEKMGIADLFTCVIDGNGVKQPKPDPEVFLNAARGMDLTPEECLVFEDAASGVEAGKKGGFRVIGVGNPAIAELADEYYTSLLDFRIEKYA